MKDHFLHEQGKGATLVPGTVKLPHQRREKKINEFWEGCVSQCLDLSNVVVPVRKLRVLQENQLPSIFENACTSCRVVSHISSWLFLHLHRSHIIVAVPTSIL